MGFTEAYIVWEGALEDEREFPFGEEDALGEWAFEAIAEGRARGDVVEVFTIAHDHEPFTDGDGEDVCVQYLTDHSPTWTTQDHGSDEQEPVR